MLQKKPEVTGFIHKGKVLMTKTIDKVQKITTTPHEERLKQLKQIFPESLTEGKIDPGKLNNLLLREIRGGDVNRIY